MSFFGEHRQEDCPQRGIENVAFFGAWAVALQVAEFVGDTLHSPQVMDVPPGATLALSLAVAGLGTAVVDRIFMHRPPDNE